jgi:formate/nitrite transporter FocA (FNT family)
MDHVLPQQWVCSDAGHLQGTKAALPVRDLMIRGILAGAFLGYAKSLVMLVMAQGLPSIVGAILFPLGFGILVFRSAWN